MGKGTNLGLAKPDDPMFMGGPELFSRPGRAGSLRPAEGGANATSLEQQAQAWVDSRQKLLDLTAEWDKQGLSFNEDPRETDPDSLLEPLRSAVLELLSTRSSPPAT